MSSVVAIPVPTAFYREEQLFGWWTYALMAAMVAAALLLLTHRPEAHEAWGAPASLAIVVGLTLPAGLTLGLLRMTTEVAATRINVWFGWIPTYRRAISIDAIVRVEVITYRPIDSYGGLVSGAAKDGGRVLRARGDRGVRLLLTGGGHLLIGSQRPEALASAIEGAMPPRS